MKKAKKPEIQAIKKVQGLEREHLIRPRSVIFADKTKFNRARIKQQLRKYDE